LAYFGGVFLVNEVGDARVVGVGPVLQNWGEKELILRSVCLLDGTHEDPVRRIQLAVLALDLEELRLLPGPEGGVGFDRGQGLVPRAFHRAHVNFSQGEIGL